MAKSALRPDDLPPANTCIHVAIYAGSGGMVQSPRTGSAVQTIAVSTATYAREYAGARRLIG